jgi:hypothetical protein
MIVLGALQKRGLVLRVDLYALWKLGQKRFSLSRRQTSTGLAMQAQMNRGGLLELFGSVSCGLKARTRHNRTMVGK